jgi:hypothetical protein
MSKVVFGWYPPLSCLFDLEVTNVPNSVGNVPYNMGEEQLIDVFKSVGQVIGFRCFT